MGQMKGLELSKFEDKTQLLAVMSMDFFENKISQRDIKALLLAQATLA